MARNGFRRTLSGNNSVYTCDCCGKRTRETGLGEAGLGLCAYCYEEAGEENMFNDGHTTEAEFNIRIFALRKQFDRCYVCGSPDPFCLAKHSSAERDVAIFKGTTGAAPDITVEQREVDDVRFAEMRAATAEAEPEYTVMRLHGLTDGQLEAVRTMVEALGGQVL